MNIEELNKVMDLLKSDLGVGLISSDIWKKGDPKPIVSYKGDIKAVSLFDQIIANIEKASEIASFPRMQEYFIMRLEGNMYFIVVFVNDLEWKIAIDGNKINLGLVLNVALPNVIEAIKNNY